MQTYILGVHRFGKNTKLAITPKLVEDVTEEEPADGGATHTHKYTHTAGIHTLQAYTHCRHTQAYTGTRRELNSLKHTPTA